MAGGVLRCGGKFPPTLAKSAKMGKDLHPMESIPKGFLANGVHKIHEEHVLNVISSTGVAGGKEW